MKTKLSFLVTALVLIFSLTLSAIAAPVFTDVQYGSWYYDAVMYTAENEVMNGVVDDCFAPETELTRAMVVTVLARLANAKTDVATTPSFEDVSFDTWYGLSVEWAKQNGIVKGVSETKFEPETNVTREQVCVMLSNFLDYLDLSTANTPKEDFADKDSISSWAIDAVLRLQYAGIVNGQTEEIDGTEQYIFNPLGNTTRAEFAQIVYNSNLANVVDKSDDAKTQENA